MKKIKLTQNKYTLVDNEDFDFLNQWKWHVVKIKNIFRPVRKYWDKNLKKYKTIYIYRLIMDCPNNMVIDHIDHNGLNNQKSNLRICTIAENCRNKKFYNNISGYKGISWHKQVKKWQSRIKVNYKNISLGYFKSKYKAALAYNQAAIKYFGEFALLNKL